MEDQSQSTKGSKARKPRRSAEFLALVEIDRDNAGRQRFVLVAPGSSVSACEGKITENFDEVVFACVHKRAPATVVTTTVFGKRARKKAVANG